MNSADAVSPFTASSPSTFGRSLLSSNPGQVDPPSEQHVLHTTPSMPVHAHPSTDTVSAVLDSRVDNLVSDVGENAFTIIGGESQDDSADDSGHESVDVQGREDVMVMDNGDDGQQWVSEQDNHDLKRAKVRLISQ